jgi:hypothetical protein
MSGDEPSLEPARGLSPLGTHILIGGLAFAGGIVGTALVLQLSGSWPRAPAPVTASALAPQPTPPALPPGTDLASLSAREQALATRLDQLDARLRDVDAGARNASSYATQAERLMIAFSVRRAIERGLPLGPLEAQLRRRFDEAHGEAVATIIGAAREPVTLEDLRLALDLIAPRLGTAPADSVWTSFRRALGDMVVLRQGDSPSSRSADRLKRARRTLEEGQVEAALAEVAHLPGVARAESWVTAAKRYIAARTALREIEAAAMETPAAPPRAGA